MSSAKGIGDRSKTTLSFCSVSVGARAVGSDDDVTISFSRLFFVCFSIGEAEGRDVYI